MRKMSYNLSAIQFLFSHQEKLEDSMDRPVIEGFPFLTILRKIIGRYAQLQSEARLTLVGKAVAETTHRHYRKRQYWNISHNFDILFMCIGF